MAGIASLSNTARDMFRGPRGVAGFIPHLKDGGEATYRSPLFGPKVDRYIPPEVRQILGAAVAGADMLNPVSAYREYVKDVREGDVVGATTNLTGFVAPGAAGALASRLGRAGVMSVSPYSDDATMALLEMLSPTGTPKVGGDADLEHGVGSIRMPSAEASQRTQIAGTFPTYEKAVKVFEEVAPEGRSLDYGAGLGKSSELGFDTFEPFAREGFNPTYRASSEIPDASYERVTNLNVLNVLDPETRRNVVLDIGRVLKPEGVAVITTRGRDVLTAKGERGPEDMSVITTAGTYQKGFTKPELVSYLRDTLGEGFEVSPLNLGPAGALVRKLPVGRPD